MKLQEIYKKAIVVGKAVLTANHDEEEISIEPTGGICVMFTKWFGNGETDFETVYISEYELETLTTDEIIVLRKKEIDEYEAKCIEEDRIRNEKQLLEEEERQRKVYEKLKTKFG